MKIWAYSMITGKTELVDTCTKNDSYYTVHEYQLAFGRDFKVWAGLKRDNPLLKPMSRDIDETAHYRGY